ncbi:hypothetical protein E1262_09835 [Jiangella aurantiaca]|uniref:Uncharacterized protein n=1 Tax=Jiangella aurantiaca TaxID=2530373 RepID=A0A4V2YSM8_9ACTN|nr:hypothetical protein [Jiangella aurantiaca]TDD70527.1 hypothetical protein E1262_09835 [Jiangella aurantiaca]
MSGSGQSVLRQAVESLLRARADAERGLDELTARVAKAAVRPAETARAGRHPLARRAGDDAAALAGAIPDELAALSTATRTAIATEVHALLDLLAVNHHQLPPLPPLDARPLSVPGATGFLTAFPEGFARSYVATVLGDLSSGRTTSKAEASAHPGAQQAAIDAARDQIVAAVAPEHRERVREWLSHPDCHAVEVHGPQVSDRDLEFRAGWTRPPDHGTEGADKWRVRPDDGKVISKHRPGAEASRFNSPAAFARPLGLLLAHADQYPGGLEQLLADHADDGAVAFFLPAATTDLRPGDTFGYRGAGTGTAEAASDWVRVRAAAMGKDGECAPPVRALTYDPVTDGSDPGVRVVFKEGTNGWVMTTYYPSTAPGPDNVRLEYPT